ALEVLVAAAQGGGVQAGGGEAAFRPGVDVQQGHARLATGQAQQGFGRGVQPDLAFGGEQRRFQQRPQRCQASVFVLQGGHGGQVVQSHQPGVLDLGGEAVLGREGGVGGGHAGVEQGLFQAFGHRRQLFGRAAQQEGQQAQRAASVVGVGPERAG